MLSNGVDALAFLFSLSTALPLVSASPLAPSFSAVSILGNRTANLQLENNLAWVHKWAAVGDSYAVSPTPHRGTVRHSGTDGILGRNWGGKTN